MTVEKKVEERMRKKGERGKGEEWKAWREKSGSNLLGSLSQAELTLA